jgi:hypothetical protein
LSLVEGMRRQFPDVKVDGSVWSALQAELLDRDVALLQTYWVDTQLRGKDPKLQGPEWIINSRRGRVSVTAGMQRYPGDSRRGLDHLLPPGLGPEEHMRRARALESPFRPGIGADDDTGFAARALAIFGPRLLKWRLLQLAAFRRCVLALEPLALSLRGSQPESVNKVASNKNPAVMAFLAVLLRWPDVTQAQQYVLGFPIWGNIGACGVLRDLPPKTTSTDAVESFLDSSEAAAAVRLQAAAPPPRDAAKLWTATLEDRQSLAGSIISVRRGGGPNSSTNLAVCFHRLR